MNSARSWLGDAALCLTFYTRLPLPAGIFDARRSFAEAQWAAPVAGAVIASVGAGIYALALSAGLPSGPAAAIALGAILAVTGCLHEDGLADTADGLGGGATRARKLEIMRDSRIGTFGACALVLSLLLRWTALVELTAPGQVWPALLAAHAGSRALIPAALRWLPPARTDGLSAGAGRPSSRTAGMGALVGVAALLTLGYLPALAAVAILGLWFVAFRRFCLRQIGGQTGDTIGALQQGGEIAVLLVASAMLP